jgi:hypothetical protein
MGFLVPLARKPPAWLAGTSGKRPGNVWWSALPDPSPVDMRQLFIHALPLPPQLRVVIGSQLQARLKLAPRCGLRRQLAPQVLTLLHDGVSHALAQGLQLSVQSGGEWQKRAMSHVVDRSLGARLACGAYLESGSSSTGQVQQCTLASLYSQAA